MILLALVPLWLLTLVLVSAMCKAARAGDIAAARATDDAGTHRPEARAAPASTSATSHARAVPATRPHGTAARPARALAVAPCAEAASAVASS